MTPKRWFIAGGALALVALCAGLLFWSHSTGKPIRPDQVTLNIGVSEPDAVISDVEIITAHVYTPSKVHTRFFIRIESSSDNKNWRTIESALVAGPVDSLRTEQKITSTNRVYYRATAWPMQNTLRQVAASSSVILEPLDLKPMIREYFKASNAAWASSTSAGLNFWADNSYPGLYDTQNDGWTRAAADYLATGYFESAEPHTIAIFAEKGWTPQATGCELQPPTPIKERVFKLSVTVTTGHNKPGIDHNPRTWLHRVALVDGKLYGFGNPCQAQ